MSQLSLVMKQSKEHIELGCDGTQQYLFTELSVQGFRSVDTSQLTLHLHLYMKLASIISLRVKITFQVGTKSLFRVTQALALTLVHS
jgi:hypothetical protein